MGGKLVSHIFWLNIYSTCLALDQKVKEIKIIMYQETWNLKGPYPYYKETVTFLI